MTDEPADLDETSVDVGTLYDVLEARCRPVVTTAEVAAAIECSIEAAERALAELADGSEIGRLTTDSGDDVWFAGRIGSDDERLTVFESRRQIVADRPTQYTRALLTQFAHLEETNREGGYVYTVREEDIWNAPYETLTELTATVRSALGGHYEALEEWIEGQWERAHKFRLTTHEDGYVVLESKSADLLGNVAEPKLDDDVLRARIGDATAWVADDKTADLKRTLYEAF